jgi:hypothetical protein
MLTKSGGGGELAVWADDGSEIAFIVNATEAGPVRHQVFLQNPDGSNHRIVGAVRPYQATGLYYMKRGGYLVAQAAPEDGGIQFDKIALSGKEITIFESNTPDSKLCPGSNGALARHSMIPSPNGELLAHVYSQECGSATIEFLQAKNLEMLDDAYTVMIDRPAWATWHPDGHLILALEGGKPQAWKVSPQQAPAETAYPRCRHPVTTSSATGTDGRVVTMNGSTATIESGGSSFGCQ